jgi:hypothetical protein
MTVKELIEKLGEFDPEMEVRIEGFDPTDWRYVNTICGIEVGTGDEDDEDEEFVLINGGDF